ncbi:tetratricopeptide repeat protein [Alysiella crassa]|uniref:protein O-GlcNAc transferase n=1 Tax=Alysiella crassa TaxID=153491 RepID=A0A376BUI9_9NEIS|nr:tetratricopeptide repeat protein [Alysiella crassa]UOP06014.1 tetratricopeptide repeat protein [Alysiella crassa]SSY80463.1 Predicted O-linked N-acetylglucosamine transferase, SPINDLY family [Alysiella crassa]
MKNQWEDEYNHLLATRHSDDIHTLLAKMQDLRVRFPNVRQIEMLYAGLLVQNKQVQQAIEVYQQLPQPDAEILSRTGMLYYELQDIQAALSHLAQAENLSPNDINILINHGFLLQTDGNLAAASARFERVLHIDPNHEDAIFRLAWLDAHRGDFARALTLYERIPYHLGAQGSALFYRHYIMPNRPDQITLAAQKVGKMYSHRNTIAPNPKTVSEPEKPLKIGLVSADLNNHVVGFFIESLLSGKATQQYQWFAYYNHTADDRVSRHLKLKFKAWHEIKYWSLERIVQQIRDDDVDILIDLSGYTGGGRLEIFAAQAAPLQAAWLGYFGTTGLPEMQAIIADPYCVPHDEEFLYTEKVYRLPHTRLCMTAPSASKVGNVIAGRIGQSETINVSVQPKLNLPIEPTPALKNGYITFGCYQNYLKINDVVLQTWAKIARRLPESRWHFQNGRLGENSEDLAIFKQRLQQFGFDLEKVSCVGSMARQDYLLNYNQVDIVLDTFPYTGGTTTAEAIWMATPTLTWAMAGMIARQGEQMMCAAGYPDWVCRSETEYVDKAVYWGQPENFAQLNELHMNMREKVAQSPLFNTEQFATDWCALIRQMWRDFCVDNAVPRMKINTKPMLVARRKA